MTNQTTMKRTSQVRSTGFHRPISGAGSETIRAMEHIRPEFRDGLALLDSRGLLAIIWVNQFPDVPADSAGGKNTLVVRMGQMTSRWLYLLLWAMAYASVVGLVVSELLPAEALVGLLSMPLAVYVTVQLFRHFKSRAIKTAQAGTIYLHLVTGLLLVLGVWLAI